MSNEVVLVCEALALLVDVLTAQVLRGIWSMDVAVRSLPEMRMGRLKRCWRSVVHS